MQGWTAHLSITIGFVIAAALWATSAVLALRAVLPTQFSGVALHVRDVYGREYLADDDRVLQLEFIRLFERAIQENARKLPPMRQNLRLALILIAGAPVAGIVTAICLHMARLLFLR